VIALRQRAVIRMNLFKLEYLYIRSHILDVTRVAFTLAGFFRSLWTVGKLKRANSKAIVTIKVVQFTKLNIPQIDEEINPLRDSCYQE